ncbi:hypothetical protein [Geotalea sp. SG265]|uniref:hypothetical protein n=1 Tax=Geotalea sp. SG265 TaxID=2922867 RepID=UPI001FAE8D44|nr:hypothetical protein [Geotalea sp. SG265]
MPRIELTASEATMLSEILQSYLKDLRAEIVATENREWREEMKNRENFVKGVVQRLSAG